MRKRKNTANNAADCENLSNFGRTSDLSAISMFNDENLSVFTSEAARVFNPYQSRFQELRDRILTRENWNQFAGVKDYMTDVWL